MGSTKDYSKRFLEERSAIIKDIEQFLFMVCKHFTDWEKCLDPESFNTETVCSLIKSLCLIHGLYGYPALNSSTHNITVDKQAVKWLSVLSKIKANGKAFVDFYQKANDDNFWQFNFKDSNISLREPAHILLQLVRDLFCDFDEAADLGRKCLEDLPDINFLKPSVWAEHKDKPRCCGVSLGVRRFVRPEFLYFKLLQLRNIEYDHNGVNLENVNAFQRELTKKKLISSLADAPQFKKSEYNIEKEPCPSCQVFFGYYELSLDNLKTPPSFSPFGNCAEYDVIRTKNLDYLLAYHSLEWALFEKACQDHFKAFEELTVSLQEAEPKEQCGIIEAYYNNTSNAKILIYGKIAEPGKEPQFMLFAENWRPGQRQAKGIETKRRKTAA